MTTPVLPLRHGTPRRGHHSGEAHHGHLHSMALHWTLFFVLALLLVLLLSRSAAGLG